MRIPTELEVERESLCVSYFRDTQVITVTEVVTLRHEVSTKKRHVVNDCLPLGILRILLLISQGYIPQRGYLVDGEAVDHTDFPDILREH